MKYQKNPAFQKYHNEVKKLKEKYFGVEFEFDIQSLNALIAFHKKNKFAFEEEVRLMYLPDMFTHTEGRISDFKTGKYHTGLTEYVEIPIYYNESPDRVPMATRDDLRLTYSLSKAIHFDTCPKIKIVEIQFGDNETKIDENKYARIKHEVFSYVYDRLGYSVKISDELFETGVLKK